jgi:8-oxo-dGTP pyrophosphatase MutT (NUDIX family)
MAFTIKRRAALNIYVVGRVLIKNKGRYLLLKRKSNETYGNLWELPGGKLETLEAIKTGVIREVFEETGLIVDFNINKVYINSFIAREGGHIGSTYLNLIFTDAKIIAGDIKIRNEHQKYGWFSEKDVLSLDLTDYMQMPLTELLLPR